MRWPPLLAAGLIGCGTLSGARPLEPGHHEVGVTLGGPLLRFGGPLPLPNVVVGARSGLGHIADRPFDLGYGMNLTGLPFGIVALHGDLGWLALAQNGAVPALTVRNKLFFTTNLVAGNKAEGVPRGVWAVDQIDLIASWKVGGSVVYGSLGQVFDLGNPQLVLVPGLGASIDPGREGGVTLQPELRWWAINRSSVQRNVQWVPGTPGAIGVHLGLAVPLGSRGDR
ncbi:MAG: hypothetical protein KTR31_28985 [Myxococcales bacterium]|nr:hypothetical protein [Myxococcales bacterium]